MIMEYKLICKIKGCYSAYEDAIPVELSEKEFHQILKTVDTQKDLPAWAQIKKNRKKIYKKIVTAAIPFITYVENVECRQNGDTTDVCYEPIDIDALLKEDIEKNGFIPHDENGHPYIAEELLRQWIKWEVDMLKEKSYEERNDYYSNRFKLFDESSFDFNELKFLKFSFRFPKEFNINE